MKREDAKSGGFFSWFDVDGGGLAQWWSLFSNRSDGLQLKVGFVRSLNTLIYCITYASWVQWIHRIHGDSGDVFDSGEVLLMIQASFWWFRWCCWWSRWFWWIRRFCWRCCWWIRRIHDFPARFFDYSGEGLLDLGFWFGWERKVWMREKVMWEMRWISCPCL